LDKIIKSGGQTKPPADKNMRMFLLQQSCRIAQGAMVAAATQL